MDSVNYILTAVICSCEGGLDAHANKERGNILSSEGETLVGSGVVGNPYLMGVTSELLVIHPTISDLPIFARKYWLHSRKPPVTLTTCHEVRMT